MKYQSQAYTIGIELFNPPDKLMFDSSDKIDRKTGLQIPIRYGAVPDDRRPR